MEIEQFIIEQEIRASGSQFLQNLKVGDHVIVYMTNNIFREAIIESEPYSAPSGATYIDVAVLNRVLSSTKRYAVPLWDLHPMGSKSIIYTAYIYSTSYRGPWFNGRGGYRLVCEGKTLKTAAGCYGRKDANARLLDEDLLKKYNINQVYSDGKLIYDK